MDYTQVIIGIIGVLITLLLGLVSKQLIPWLKDKHLYDAAIVAVNAAEAIYGRYNGSQKLKAALESLKQKGFNINSTQVAEAVEAAWKQLDQAMHMSGEKYEDEEEDQEQATEE